MHYSRFALLNMVRKSESLIETEFLAHFSLWNSTQCSRTFSDIFLPSRTWLCVVSFLLVESEKLTLSTTISMHCWQHSNGQVVQDVTGLTLEKKIKKELGKSGWGTWTRRTFPPPSTAAGMMPLSKSLRLCWAAAWCECVDVCNLPSPCSYSSRL